jgi:hypothetical protein
MRGFNKGNGAGKQDRFPDIVQLDGLQFVALSLMGEVAIL